MVAGVRWPFRRKAATETRSMGGYTEAAIEAVWARATGQAKADTLAVSAACLGLIARCFLLARQDPDVMPASELARHARRVMAGGESVCAWERGAGGFASWWCETWQVEGKDMREGEWRYLCDFRAPSDGSERRRMGSEVWHFRNEPAPAWRGRAPLDLAAISSAVAAATETAVRSELNLPSAVILPQPAGDAEGKTATLAREVNQAKGVALLLETTKTGGGAGFAAAPGADWRATTIKPAPDAGLLGLRAQLTHDVCGAFGVPPVLLASGSESGRREAMRFLVLTTLAGIAAIIETEVQAKAGIPLAINFDRLRAADTAGMARSVKAFKEAGMTLAEAKAVVGL